MRTALFLSPHLDDVVFSCGGLAALLHDRGWRTILATAFTATVLPVTGFALACQLDKGLDPDVDYMALRRDEDHKAAAIIGFSEVLHLDLPEAPHRGYESAAALFGPIQEGDDVCPALVARLMELQGETNPTIVLGPQGLGNHVDHMQMVLAVDKAITAPLALYRDTPYAIRHPGAQSACRRDFTTLSASISTALNRKLEAACAYGSQIGFQFGGPARTAEALRDFAASEAGDGTYAERLAVSKNAKHLLIHTGD